MRLCSIAMNSGNCIYTGTDHTHLLGLIQASVKENRRRNFMTWRSKGEEIDGILITHEHSDHIQD